MTGLARVSLGSFSEAQSVFDLELLSAVMRELMKDIAGDPPESLAKPPSEPYHYLSHSHLRQHLASFLDAYNFAKRLKSLAGLSSFQFICSCFQKQPSHFISNSHYLSLRLNI